MQLGLQTTSKIVIVIVKIDQHCNWNCNKLQRLQLKLQQIKWLQLQLQLQYMQKIGQPIIYTFYRKRDKTIFIYIGSHKYSHTCLYTTISIGSLCVYCIKSISRECPTLRRQMAVLTNEWIGHTPKLYLLILTESK